jgi:hypothetical protein
MKTLIQGCLGTGQETMNWTSSAPWANPVSVVKGALMTWSSMRGVTCFMYAMLVSLRWHRCLEGNDFAVSFGKVAGVLHALLSPRAQYFEVCLHAC